jgi:hypothetical protein
MTSPDRGFEAVKPQMRIACGVVITRNTRAIVHAMSARPTRDRLFIKTLRL